MEGYFLTDCGKVRSTNEDAGGVFSHPQDQTLAIVADGMGGHQAGEVASSLAVELFKKAWEETGAFTSSKEAESWLFTQILDVNRAIYEEAEEQKEYQGMGTTVVVTVVTKDFVTIGHVGDSRCYLWTQPSQLRQMTSDHSLVNELVKTGQISPSDAEVHPRKNVLMKALGTEVEIEPDIQSIPWTKGDCLLLASDGLTNKVKKLELEEALATMESLEETAKYLIDLANDRGGEDNITLVIVQNKEGDAL